MNSNCKLEPIFSKKQGIHATLKSRRKRWVRVHLWLGLVLGGLLSVYGITGSILVFHAEIDELLHPELLTVKIPVDKTYKPLAELIAVGKTVMPLDAQNTFATYPRNAKAALKLNYTFSTSSGVQNWLVAVNPYTAKITGTQLQARSTDLLPATLIKIIFKLHFALLLPNGVSNIVVGISTAFLIISVLTGLIVWYPLTGKWCNALSFKKTNNPIRLNYDLHKTSGVYSSLIMLPVLFSGIYMILPHNVVPVIELFSPVTYSSWFKSSEPYPNASAISMNEAVEIALQHYPQGRPHLISGAPNANQAYTICQDGVKNSNSLLQRRCMVIDRYSGKILDLDDPSLPNVTAGEIFTHWQWSLHSGQAFGMTGRILVFITGLICPVLFITGIIRWRQKSNVVSHHRLVKK
jgi:uncharacterized iron-regulated membrane protein